MRNMKNLVPTLLLALPTVASAQLGQVGNLLGQFDQVIRFSLTLIAGIALLVFFWGLVKFIFAAGSEEAKDQGKRIMIWGVVALFVMISVWGLVAFLQVAFLGGTSFPTPQIPTF
jgi:hypothetical protein